MNRYCLQCDDGTELTYEKRDITINYRDKVVVVSNVEGWHCPICGECEFINEIDSRRHMDAFNALIASTKTIPRIRIDKKIEKPPYCNIKQKHR